ncbi:MAG: ATP-binding protein [Gammaproteobacteria bacterium]
MLDRMIQLDNSYSFFLFGARGTGKSTWLKHCYNTENTYWIDLLNLEEEESLSKQPNDLFNRVLSLPESITHVVIDEIQKIPKLLDVVHRLIENETIDKIFILTGSSARKLKYGGANLLAGRAFVYHLFPFSYLELKEQFNLGFALTWGLLPKIYLFTSDKQRLKFFQAYTNIYLKEEVWAEHLIRKLPPFRRFLEVAAQANGKIINYSNIAKDVGVDDKTVHSYFVILEDTLLGFFLEPYHHSFRKRLSEKPKFYFIDVGIARALSKHLSIPVQPKTSYYGEIFEQFIVVECFKCMNYFSSEYQMYYLRTKDDAEIDIIVTRPGKPLLCIEIKSSSQISEPDLKSFINLTKDLAKSLECEAVCFSQDPHPKQIENVLVLPWAIGIKKYFLTV